jgi:hypothetical protein
MSLARKSPTLFDCKKMNILLAMYSLNERIEFWRQKTSGYHNFRKLPFKTTKKDSNVTTFFGKKNVCRKRVTKGA